MRLQNPPLCIQTLLAIFSAILCSAITVKADPATQPSTQPSADLKLSVSDVSVTAPTTTPTAAPKAISGIPNQFIGQWVEDKKDGDTLMIKADQLIWTRAALLNTTADLLNRGEHVWKLDEISVDSHGVDTHDRGIFLAFNGDYWLDSQGVTLNGKPAVEALGGGTFYVSIENSNLKLQYIKFKPHSFNTIAGVAVETLCFKKQP